MLFQADAGCAFRRRLENSLKEFLVENSASPSSLHSGTHTPKPHGHDPEGKNEAALGCSVPGMRRRESGEGRKEGKRRKGQDRGKWGSQ